MVADVVKTPLPTVTMVAAWMMLILPVTVFQDSLEKIVLSISMNVKQQDARMENVKTSLMLFSVHAIQGGLEFFVVQTLMTVFWIPLGLDHVMTLGQVPVLMATPRICVSVWTAMLVMTAP